MRAHTHIFTHTQFNYKEWHLGYYAIEVHATAARDVVAKVLGYHLNFKEPRKITGQRSIGASCQCATCVQSLWQFTGNPIKSYKTYPWISQITVSSEQSSQNMGYIVSALMRALMHAH